MQLGLAVGTNRIKVNALSVEVEESDHRDDDRSDDEGKELALLPADIVKTKQRRASHAARTRSRNKQN